jgi:hypothetical protein
MARLSPQISHGCQADQPGRASASKNLGSSSLHATEPAMQPIHQTITSALRSGAYLLSSIVADPAPLPREKHHQPSRPLRGQPAITSRGYILNRRRTRPPENDAYRLSDLPCLYTRGLWKLQISSNEADPCSLCGAFRGVEDFLKAASTLARRPTD